MSSLANGALARLARAELDIQKLDAEKAERSDLNRLADEVAGLRKAIIGAAITIGTSAIIFAFTMVATLQ